MGKIRSALIALLLLPLSNRGDAGGMISSGGEYVTNENNPWFIGSRPVTYCIDIAAGHFSASKPSAQRMVRVAINEWVRTIKALMPMPTSEFYLDGVPKNIAVDFIEEECAGDTELTFLLGRITEDVRNTLKQMARITLAFATRTTYDPQTGRSKGVIWLAPDNGDDAYQGPKWKVRDFWTAESSLYAVLLHELGHLLGFKHQSGVMAHNIPASVVSRESSQERYSPWRYAMQRWHDRDVQACGFVYTNDEAKKVFNLQETGSDYWLACLKRIDSSNLRLELKTRSGQLRRRLELIQEKVFYSEPLPAVTGDYKRITEPPAGTTVARGHVFVTGYAPSVNVRFLTRSGEHIARLHTSEDKVSFEIVSEGILSFSHFEIIFPHIESSEFK